MKLPPNLRRFLEGKQPIERPLVRGRDVNRRRPCGAGAPSDSLTRTLAAERIGRSVPSLHRFERLGLLVPKRTNTGRPFYTPAQLDEFLKLNEKD